MPNADELIRVFFFPLLVSACVALIGRWRMWAWAMPLAAGVGFMVGVAAYVGHVTGHTLGRPDLPPSDGTDWIFWLAIPLTLIGMLDAKRGGKWGWLLGLSAAAMVYVIARPLMPKAATPGHVALVAFGLAMAATAAALIARVARPRIGSWAVGIALAITLGGAAVVIMSSNVRIVGVYGIAAAAATGPAAVFMPRKGRGVTVVAMGLLAGMLAGGRFYAEPCVTVSHMIVLAAAPLLLIPAAFVPTKQTSIRAIIGVLLVAAAVGAVAVPTAIAAKHASEDDPYGSAN